MMAAGVCALSSLIKYVASLVLLYFTFVEVNNHFHCILLIWNESLQDLHILWMWCLNYVMCTLKITDCLHKKLFPGAALPYLRKFPYNISWNGKKAFRLLFNKTPITTFNLCGFKALVHHPSWIFEIILCALH